MERRVTIDNRVRVDVDGIDAEVLSRLRGSFEHRNPDYSLKFFRRKQGAGAAQIRTWRRDPDGRLSFPRGGFGRVRDVLLEGGVDIEVVDGRRFGERLEKPFEHSRALYPHQEEIARVVLEREQCIVRAPTGSGKTSALLAIAARVEVPTVVMVHSGGLFEQWVARAEGELGIARGEIGMLRGTARRLAPLTIALQKTLNKVASEPDVRDYFGCVIVDECFESDTPVLMADGHYKSISHVAIGDVVALGGRVLALSRRRARVRHAIEGYCVTANHPIAVAGVGWCSASQVTEDDLVYVDPHFTKRTKSRSGTWRLPVAEGERGEIPMSAMNGEEAGRMLPLTPDVMEFENATLGWGARLTPRRSNVVTCPELECTVYNLETTSGAYVAAGVLVHNCQFAAARTFLTAIDPFPARYRVGASADHRRKDKKEFLTYDLFGDVGVEIGRERLVEAGVILDVEARVVPTEFRADWYGFPHPSTDREYNFSRLVKEMGEDDARNALVVEVACAALGAGEQVLLLAHEREHCRRLAPMFLERGIATGYLIGGADYALEFRSTIDGILGGTIRVGIGTYPAIGTGIDLPRVGTAIAVTPISSNEQLFNQVRGRVCRIADGKRGAKLFVMWDRHVYPKHLANVRRWNGNTMVLHGGNWMSGERYAAGRVAVG